MDLNRDFLHQLYNHNQPKAYWQVEQLFEENYHKLCRLIPTIKHIEQDQILPSSALADLHLLLESRSAHTAIFTLTHQHQGVNKPDIRFKLYLDAKLLEVLSVCDEPMVNQSHPYLAKCSDLDIKYELNVFMQRWLDFCLDHYEDRQWQMR